MKWTYFYKRNKYLLDGLNDVLVSSGVLKLIFIYVFYFRIKKTHFDTVACFEIIVILISDVAKNQ